MELEVRDAPFASVRPGTAWNVSVSHSVFTYYRYQEGPESATNCRVDSDSSDPVPFSEKPVIDAPNWPGRWSLCALFTGRRRRPYPAGPPCTVNCDDVSGYNIYGRIPIRVPASASELIPLCIIAGDRNDNFTRSTQILLGENQPLPAGIVNSAGFEQGTLSSGAYASMFFASEVFPSITMQWRDAAGAVFPIPGVAAGQQLNLIVPPEAAPGPALLQIPGRFPASVLLDVQPISPGIFVNPDHAARGFLRSGLSLAIGGCSPDSCGVLPLPVPAVIQLQTNGLSALEGQAVEVHLAGQSIPGTVQFGSVHFSIPVDFPYRGHVPVQLICNGVRSNVACRHLKDEGI